MWFGRARSLGAACAFAIIACIASSVLADEPPQAVVQTAPDAAFQAAISDVAKAVDRETAVQQADRLVKLGALDRAELISQLLWFAARNEKDAAARAVVGQVLKRLDVQKQVIVIGLAPHLDNRDESIRRIAGQLLTGFEDRSAERPPDFSAYRAIIEADVVANREPQRSLVRFMYESDAGSALIAMMRAHQLRDPEEIRSIRWAEHVIADLFWRQRFGFSDLKSAEASAVEQLEKLSRHDRWWARLYVAKIIGKHPELGRPEWVARLRADASVLVRQSMERPAAKAVQQPSR